MKLTSGLISVAYWLLLSSELAEAISRYQEGGDSFWTSGKETHPRAVRGEAQQVYTIEALPFSWAVYTVTPFIS